MITLNSFRKSKHKYLSVGEGIEIIFSGGRIFTPRTQNINQIPRAFTEGQCVQCHYSLFVVYVYIYRVILCCNVIPMIKVIRRRKWELSDTLHQQYTRSSAETKRLLRVDLMVVSHNRGGIINREKDEFHIVRDNVIPF